MNDKLKHLSPAQVEELIRRYYDNEKVSNLITEYKIDVLPSQLVKVFPVRSHEEICVYCDINLTSEYESKSYYRFENKPKCRQCGHTLDMMCYCRNCVDARKQIQIAAQKSKSEKIKEALGSFSYDKIDLSTLSFVEKVYLGAFIREGIREDFNVITSIDSFLNKLAPTDILKKDIIELLSKKRELLLIDESSDPNSIVEIVLDGNNASFSYYPDSVNWKLNIHSEGLSKIGLVNSLMNPIDEFVKEDLFAMWKNIALHECLDYLTYTCGNVLGVDYTVGEKTVAVINDLLNHFSTSQIYGIIYKSV